MCAEALEGAMIAVPAVPKTAVWSIRWERMCCYRHFGDATCGAGGGSSRPVGNRCRRRNCLREGVSAFFITVGAGNGPVATDGASAPRVYPLGYRRILALIKLVPCEARAGP